MAIVIRGVEASSDSALFRILKGTFGFIAGKLVAASDLPLIDTPLGRIRSIAPGAGFGTLALGVLTLSLIQELKADSADIAYLDGGTSRFHKDLKHRGVFTIVTKSGQVVVVDDPTQTIIIRPFGSGVAIQKVFNSPAEMLRHDHDYSDVHSTYVDGLNDPFIQQYRHANADPQSTGGDGSSTSPTILTFNNNFSSQGTNNEGNNSNNNANNNSGSHGTDNGGKMTTDFFSAPPPPPPPGVSPVINRS